MNTNSEVYKVLDRIARETADIIDREVPVKTGTLQKSIDWKIVTTPTVGLQFSMIYYGEFVDQGTRYIVPRHFFQKNIDDQMAKYKSDIAYAWVRDTLNNNKII